MKLYFVRDSGGDIFVSKDYKVTMLMEAYPGWWIAGEGIEPKVWICNGAVRDITGIKLDKFEYCVVNLELK